MHRVTIGLRPYLALAVFCLILYLPGLAAVPPLDRDEARFAQATRQMLETGDFVHIHFQNTPRHKKPVGIHWLQAAAVKMFGDPAAIRSYRLPSVAGALAAVLLTFHFGQVLFDRRTALLGAALLGGALLVIIEAHQAKTDAVLLACVVAAQGALARFYLSSALAAVPGSAPPALGMALIFWLAQGIGILVKGPIVPLVSSLTIAGLWAWERTVPRWVTGLRSLTGLVVTAAVTGPWFVAISVATGGSFVSEAVRVDLLPKLLGAQESHGAPPGYFLFLATLTFWPASLFLWPALAQSWRQRTTPAVRFCLAWSGLVWLVLEAVPTKLPHYILPVYPALALLVAAAVWSAGETPSSPLRTRWARLWYGGWAVLTATLGGAFLTAPMLFGGEAFPWGTAGTVGFTAWGTAWGTVCLAWRGQFLPAMVIAGMGAGVMAATIFAVLIPSLESLWLSQRVQAVLAATAADRTQPVAAAGYHEPSLVFLLGTSTILADGSGAAAHVTAAPAAVAVVSQGEDETFRQALAARGFAPDLLSTIDGLNYSRGRRETLRVYRAMPR